MEGGDRRGGEAGGREGCWVHEEKPVLRSGANQEKKIVGTGESKEIVKFKLFINLMSCAIEMYLINCIWVKSLRNQALL